MVCGPKKDKLCPYIPFPPFCFAGLRRWERKQGVARSFCLVATMILCIRNVTLFKLLDAIVAAFSLPFFFFFSNRDLFAHDILQVNLVGVAVDVSSSTWRQQLDNQCLLWRQKQPSQL